MGAPKYSYGKGILAALRYAGFETDAEHVSEGWPEMAQNRAEWEGRGAEQTSRAAREYDTAAESKSESTQLAPGSETARERERKGKRPGLHLQQ